MIIRLLSISRLSTIIIFSVLALLSLTLFLFYSIGETSIVNSESMVYLSILTGSLIFFISFANRASFPIFILFAFYIIQKYCLSILLLLLHFKYVTDWRYEYYSSYTTSDLNSSMIYAVLGSFVMFIGFFVSMNPNSKKLIDSNNNTIGSSIHNIKPTYIFILFIGLMLINLYLFIIVGFGRLLISSGDSGFNFLGVFMDTTPTLWLSLGILFFGWNEISKRNRYMLILIFCFTLVLSIISGSRGFLFILILILLFLKTLKDGNFYIRSRNIIYLFIIGIFGVILFSLATAIRYASRELIITNENIIKYLNHFYFEGGNYLFVMFYDILYRLGYIASSMLIMNNKWVVKPENYITVPTMIMDTINNLVPGELFTDVIPGTRLFSYVYAGVTDPEFYSTEYFGIFEYSYILFGYTGGLVSLFIISFMIGWLWNKFLIKKIPLKHFWAIFFGFSFYFLLLNHGLSIWLSSAIRTIIVFSFHLILLKFVIPPVVDIFLMKGKHEKNCLLNVER